MLAHGEGKLRCLLLSERVGRPRAEQYSQHCSFAPLFFVLPSAFDGVDGVVGMSCFFLVFIGA